MKCQRYYALIICLLLNYTAFSQDKLNNDILMKIGRVSAPALSPDASKIVYTVRYLDVEKNSGSSDIYVQSVEGAPALRITATDESEHAVAWHPNGSKITYLSAGKKENKSSQIWEINADGSDPKQVTDVADGISNYQYAENGKALWYTSDVKMDKTVAEQHPDLPEVQARSIDGLMYRHWNAWHDYAYSHVFVADYNNGNISSAVDIMKGEKFDSPLNPFGGGSQIAISHDGNLIAYTCKKLSGTEYTKSTNSDIYVYNRTSGKTKNITEGMPGYDMDPVFTKTGKIMWHSMHDAGYEADRNQLMIANIDGGSRIEMIKDFDYSVGQTVIGPDGKRVYFVAGIKATYQIFHIPLNANEASVPQQLTNVNANIRSVAVGGKSSRPVIIVSKQSISYPTEIFRVMSRDGSLTAVSEINKDLLSKIKPGKVEKRMIKTTDGKDMLTWVIYPPDFDPAKKYPTLLYCQGGPQATVSQFFSYRWNFQLMAANGYIVVAPNRRGLPSFGEEWNDQITGDWGGQAMKDYLSAIDAVAAEPYADNDKLGAVGASFGGYSVFYLAGNHDNRFKAFIAHCGVFNLESMYGSTEEIFFVDHDLGGPYWKSPKPVSYTKFSPHDYVQNWNTPILVIHNELDFRVPLAQGMEAFSAAQLRGVPSRFLYFPDEGHWVLKPQNSILWQREFYSWLDKYLKN
ncbi:MAG: S9 family peptidase [Bacteroidia bacterium]|nr:S9 family peptidase [Bacteroidia bacterium]